MLLQRASLLLLCAGSALLLKSQVYEPEFTSVSMASRTIDTSRPVGVTDGTGAVNALGAANYTVPILVPPGTNAIQPNLALVYSSQGGDGVLGTGWAISGLSSISRVGKDWYHDQAATPVSFDGNDRFMTEGQRLVKLSGATYGANGATYDTERAAYSTYTSVGSLGSGPEYFTVMAKDGTYLEYGATAGSRVMGDGGASVLIWYLNKVMDPNGNYVTYSYATYNGEVVISNIAYTGNANIGLTPYNTVTFQYAGRDDVNERWVRGYGGLFTSNLLVGVTVNSEGLLVRRYELNYALRDKGKSYLREIEEVGADGATRLNSTIIRYGEEANPYITIETSPVLTGEYVYLGSGDFDGDGDSEVTATAYSYTDDGFQYNSDFMIFSRDPFGVLELKWSAGLPTGFQDVNKKTVPTTHLANVANDMNGDGREDLLFTKVSSTTNDNITTYKLDHVRVYESNTFDASGFQVTDFGHPVGYDKIHESHNYFVAGDFNGDGLGDFITLLSNGQAYHAWFTSPTANRFNELISMPVGAGVLAIFSSRLYSIDFDGDGAMDIMRIPDSNTGTTIIYRFVDGAVPAMESVYQSGFPVMDHEIHPGDFNGDGKTDLLTRYAGQGAWSISYSMGNGFYSVPFTQFTYPVGSPSSGHHLVVSDFNGDAKSDILHGYPVLGGTSALHVFYSTGSESPFHHDYHAYPSFLGMVRPIVTDVNGDGRGEVLLKSSGYSDVELFHFGMNGHERSVAAIQDGMGFETRFEYKFITDGTVHHRGYDYAYPNGNVQPPLEVVSAISTPDGNGSYATVDHTYSYSKVNQQGRGFVGFEFHRTKCEVANTRTSQENEFYEDQCVFLPKKEEVTRDDNNEVVQRTTSAYQLVPLGPAADKRFAIRQTTNSVQNLLAATSTTTTNTAWDAHGNITATTLNIGGVETMETTTAYVAVGPSTVPSKPEEVTVTRTRTGQPSVTKVTAYWYYPGSGRLGSTTEFEGSAEEINTAFAYTAAGNLAHKVSGYTGIDPALVPEETYEYDSKFRYIEHHHRHWNDNGSPRLVSTHFEHDHKWGVPTSEFSSDGLTTLHEYDVFGRLKETFAPHVSGTTRYSIRYEKDWDVDVPNNQYYVSSISDPRKGDTRTWHDLLRRAIRVQNDAFGQQERVVEMTYDDRGNAQTETTPHLVGEPYLTIERTYDGYNRLEVVAHPLRGNTTYQYVIDAGEAVVSVENAAGQVRYTTTDAAGRMVRAHDDGGELTYRYDSWGNLTRVWHESKLVLRNEYDVYGRRTETWALNAGSTDLTYNPFGQLEKQVDPLGHETMWFRDNLGRIVERVGDEGSTVYTYFDDNGLVNDNLSMVATADVVREYAYDDTYHRLTDLTSTIDGVTYSSHYSYNDLDQVTEEVYPSGLEVRYEYDEDGSLKQVSYPGGVLFEGLEQNGYGMFTKYLLGDGNQVTQEYEDRFLKRTHATGVQDLRLEHDYVSGNVARRWDAVKGRDEVFGYDDLNRLKVATVNEVDGTGQVLGQLSQTEFAYDGNIGSTKGNLVMRTDVGQLTYGGQAISSARHPDYPVPYDQPPLEISLAEQVISYTPFLMTESIREEVNGDALELIYHYGPEYARTSSELLRNGASELTRVYVGNYEKQEGPNGVEEVHYVKGGDGLCAVVVFSNGQWEAYAAYKDHLGSLVTMTETTSGVVVAEQNFDAWGRRRDPDTWEYANAPQPPTWLYRGFTGHEHADEFGLVNMNGRMYDPLLGRMLAADNFTGSGSETQPYNRYAYALNNPVLYTDPSGEVVTAAPIIIGAIYGFAVGLSVADKQGMKGEDAAMMAFGGALLGAQTGLMGGILSPALGAIMPTQFGGMLGVATASAIAGGYDSFVSTLLVGGSEHDALTSAWQGGVASFVGSALGMAVSGGAGAFVQGASSSGLKSAMAGDDSETIAKKSAIGGVTSWAMYSIQAQSAYHEYKAEGGGLSRRQFMGASRQIQRSYALGVETGGYFMADGTFKRNSRLGVKDGLMLDPVPTGAIAEFHTHPNWGRAGRNERGEVGWWQESHSSDDIDYMHPRVDSYVFGRQNTYRSDAPSIRPLFGGYVKGGPSMLVYPNTFVRYPVYLNQFR